jgi:hypothetical protein
MACGNGEGAADGRVGESGFVWAPQRKGGTWNLGRRFSALGVIGAIWRADRFSE